MAAGDAQDGAAGGHGSGSIRLPAGDLRVEWGLQLDCEVEGCNPPHSDNGRVFGEDAEPEQGWTINGHAARVVMRLVHTTPWTPRPAAPWAAPAARSTEEDA